jgi:NADH-quinone oxidoreductase subunit F
MPYPKLQNAQDLAAFRDEAIRQRSARRLRVLVCSTGCRALGALELSEAFRRKLSASGLDAQAEVVDVGCHGRCARAPLVLIEPQEYLYGGVTPQDVEEIVETTVRNGKPVERLCERLDGQVIAKMADVPFYRTQRREVFRTCGRMDPKRIEDAVAHGSYAALAKMLASMTPQRVIDEVTASGLRGRGGAGFPTGVKWNACRISPGADKYIICNADEGDPGAFMDRALLEGAPHQVIEGMTIGAYAIGASYGFIYARAEYPIAVEHSYIALEQARACGLLGRNILGSSFHFDIEVRMGAGAFVCGEESALIASLEGHRGMPRPRPPFPVHRGYLGRPTTINNVETFGNVPLIIEKGKDWFGAIGTEGSKGTKVFALAGKVRNTGLVEVPMGVTLREMVFDVGGGIPNDRAFKAAQMGGPSGGCVPAEFLDLPIDYDSVKQIGAIMGSGGLIVMDEKTCMVDTARFFLDFTRKESCGKCVPCRVGTQHMHEILNRICEGQGQEGDIEKLEQLASHVKAASLCGLGQTAPNPVLTTLKYFRQEYQEHIRLKHCRASACEALVPAPCAHACPAQVNVPQYLGLIAEGRLDDAVNVIRRRNPFVSVCGRVCDHPCERRCRRGDLDEPLAIRALKRYAADHVKDSDGTLVPPATGKAEVAVVGAGPAGLSCAYFLALMNRRSVVYESQPIPGGMLALGIPEYRLPKSVLKQDIDFIVRHGVELHTGTPVHSLAQLRELGFKAIFLATGAQESRPLGIEGEGLEGVQDCLKLLRQRGLGQQPSCGSNVVVIGGGNAAVDAARSAVRLGARTVAILYRRTRQEMPAYAEEVDEALAEGVCLQELVAPRRILGEGGKVVAVEMVRMTLGEADKTGRRRPLPVAGSEFVLPCDTVLPAIGQVASTAPGAGIGLSAGGTVQVDMVSLASSVPGVFAGGDVVTGGSTAIEAIAHGQRAAISIDRFLGGAGVLPPDVSYSLWRPSEQERERKLSRAVEPTLPAGQRRGDFREVVCGLSSACAREEAGRCLRCDLEKILSRR